tara:strand:- start:152 stop:475 length:324 start_codon:yes stop_codon:yes gene_type:complete
MANTPFKLKGFSGFGESTSPIKFHRSGRFAGESRGMHVFSGKRKRSTKTKTNIFEKIIDSEWNQKRIKKKKVNKEIKEERRRIKKSKGTGWSNPRTLPTPGSSKIYE